MAGLRLQSCIIDGEARRVRPCGEDGIRMMASPDGLRARRLALAVGDQEISSFGNV